MKNRFEGFFAYENIIVHAWVGKPIGNRDFVNPVPELIESVPNQPLTSVFWKASEEHPVVARLGDSQHEFSYPFIVSMLLGKTATVLACSPDKDAAVIVAGSLDKGRYTGCGLGLGFGQVSATLSESEKRLLLNIIYWLGQKKQPEQGKEPGQ
ncbi:MAG: hypothetical protein WCT05_03005 [Lentisphaeria bacterium]